MTSACGDKKDFHLVPLPLPLSLNSLFFVQFFLVPVAKLNFLFSLYKNNKYVVVLLPLTRLERWTLGISVGNYNRKVLNQRSCFFHSVSVDPSVGPLLTLNINSMIKLSQLRFPCQWGNHVITAL